VILIFNTSYTQIQEWVSVSSYRNSKGAFKLNYFIDLRVYSLYTHTHSQNEGSAINGELPAYHLQWNWLLK